MPERTKLPPYLEACREALERTTCTVMYVPSRPRHPDNCKCKGYEIDPKYVALYKVVVEKCGGQSFGDANEGCWGEHCLVCKRTGYVTRTDWGRDKGALKGSLIEACKDTANAVSWRRPGQRLAWKKWMELAESLYAVDDDAALKAVTRAVREQAAV